mgnify:CR=1 FL=1
MLPALKKRFAVLESQKNQLLDYYADLSPEQLAFQPTPQSWSLIQVGQHLMNTEVVVGRMATQGLEQARPGQKAPITSHFWLLFGVMMLSLPITRFKVPESAAKEIVPGPPIELEVLRDDWQKCRQHWIALLDQFTPDQAGCPVFTHPRLGRLNISQTLQFLANHFDHHLMQTGRIQRHPDYPYRRTTPKTPPT